MPRLVAPKLRLPTEFVPYLFSRKSRIGGPDWSAGQCATIGALVFMLLFGNTCEAFSTSISCDPSYNENRGVNTRSCPASDPYCAAQGFCTRCNSISDYTCDCRPGESCLMDPSDQDSYGTCRVSPLYGKACSNNGDCRSTYTYSSGGTTVTTAQLVCWDNKCRLCNPLLLANSSTTCSYGVRSGQVIKCTNPGTWATSDGYSAVNEPSRGIILSFVIISSMIAFVSTGWIY